MKKLFSLFTIFFINVNLFSFDVYWLDNEEENYFIVTAYYSPLPNQNFYLKWNYEDELKLNWNWIRWASWEPVFSWMLAAPKTYKFWTKIYLEWLWVWSVQDRWWAIVSAGNRWYNYDRIDVWVWYWDEWLKRALYWWKRKIKWNIVSWKTKTTINVSNMASPEWVTNNLRQIPNVFNLGIWIKSDANTIKNLQEFLSDVWFYDWEIDWIYNERLINTIFDFQRENSIVKTENDNWAGYWWEKTRKLFLEDYLDWDLTQKQNIKDIVKNNDNQINIFLWALDSIEKVKKLQEVLIELELYNWDIDWDYKSLIDIILDFQLDNDIISQSSDIWAWYFWPKTRKGLKVYYDEFLKEKERIKILEEKLLKLENESAEIASEKIDLLWDLKIWDVSKEVRELQIILKELWYFDYNDTAIFWEITKRAIIYFQLDKWIIDDSNSIWAWVFGPKTKEILKTNLAKIIYDENISKDSSLAELNNSKVIGDKLISVDDFVISL